MLCRVHVYRYCTVLKYLIGANISMKEKNKNLINILAARNGIAKQ